MTERPSIENKGPGNGTLVLMVAALVLGAALLGLLAPSWQSWQAGALVGYAVMGVLGLIGLWTTRRAYGAGQAVFLRLIFGFMLARLVVAGLAAGLVIGLGWLHAFGFIGGLFGGFVLFMAFEIGGTMVGATGHAS